jgi:hypothetical protein
MPAAHLEPVLDVADPVGRAALGWASALSERAGEPVPYAFALALARRHGAPATPAAAAERVAPRAAS